MDNHIWECLFIVVCIFQGKILVGTKDNDVLEIGEKSNGINVLVGGHGEGEVWGLDKHPTLPQFITASYDGTVRIWDIPGKVRQLMNDHEMA